MKEDDIELPSIDQYLIKGGTKKRVSKKKKRANSTKKHRSSSRISKYLMKSKKNKMRK
jgi:hypothetical protein